MNKSNFFLNLKGDEPTSNIADGNDEITLSGSYQNALIDLGGGNDLFNGGVGSDSVSGKAGDDFLSGGDGSDTLAGNEGNDKLVGGVGSDTLTGGSGVDLFILNRPSQGIDKITDFMATDDTLQISATDFGGGLTSGIFLAVEQFRAGSGITRATTANERFIYNTETGALFFDADGNSIGFGAVQITTLVSKPFINHDDIFVSL
jgi:Ca2+-binding RTX toxin-like protein